MAKVLVRVQRTKPLEVFISGNFHRHPNVVLTEKYDIEENDPLGRAEFFEVDERDVKTSIAEFARANPGKTVQAYIMTMEGVCPAADLVLKNVGKDGVLPV